jgi:hypothetical protein
VYTKERESRRKLLEVAAVRRRRTVEKSLLQVRDGTEKEKEEGGKCA